MTTERTPVINGKLVLGGKFPSAIREWMNNEFGTVHTIMIEDKPWFTAIEISTILEYSNPYTAIYKHTYPENRVIMNLNTLSKKEGIPSRGNPNRVFINQTGLYSLVLKSRMPKAEKFMTWIVEDVLGSIYQHGAYFTPEVRDQIIQDPTAAQNIAKQLKEEQERNATLTTKIKELTPKAKYTEDVLKSDEALTFTLVAKEFGLTAFKLHRLLKKQRIIFQFRRNKPWQVYSKYANEGWFTNQTHKYQDNAGKHHSSTQLYPKTESP